MPGSAFSIARIVNGRLRNPQVCLQNLVADPVAVLLYHRVTDLPSDAHGIAVSPSNFRAQMSYLRDNFRVVRFEEDWSALGEAAVAVTFDDGYADNLVEALPILEEAGVPATFFITTGDLGRDSVFWWDELEALLLTEGAYPPSFELLDRQHGRTWHASTIEERKALHWDLHRLIMTVNADRRNDWLSQLKTWRGWHSVNPGGGKILSLQQLRTLAESPLVTIGAHTVTHAPLSALSEEEQRREIHDSKNQLENLLGQEMAVFSYPFGKRTDYNEESIRICKEAGFKKVASAFGGHAYRWTDPFQIPRHTIYDWDLETFVTRLKCLWL